MAKRRRALFPPQAYRQLYTGAPPTRALSIGEAEGGEERLRRGRERDFFAWEYFDATLESGHHLVVALHPRSFATVTRKPFVDICVYGPDGRRWRVPRAYEEAQQSISADHYYLQIGDNRIERDEAGYTLRLRQGDLEAELVYQRELPPWQPGTGYLFRDERSGRYLRWGVPVPRAHVSGTLRLAGEEVPVVGTGYHDCNWGNLPLADAFSRWYWGRVSAEDYTVIWAEMHPVGPSGEPVSAFMLAQGEHILAETGLLRTTVQETGREPRTGTIYPRYLVVEVAGPKHSLSLRLHTARIVEAVDLPRPSCKDNLFSRLSEVIFYLSREKPVLRPLVKGLLGGISYLRMLARYELRIAGRGVETHHSGQMLYEMMELQDSSFPP